MHACMRVFVAVTCFHIAANSSQKLGGFTDLERDFFWGGGAQEIHGCVFVCVLVCVCVCANCECRHMCISFLQSFESR